MSLKLKKTFNYLYGLQSEFNVLDWGKIDTEELTNVREARIKDLEGFLD